jgi:hypothetical protein
MCYKVPTRRRGRTIQPALIEQYLGGLQIGGVEALGEPVVDLREHRARLVAAVLRCEPPREVGRCKQLEGFGYLLAKVGLGQFGLTKFGNPFFVSEPQESVVRRGVELTNFLMDKVLPRQSF